MSQNILVKDAESPSTESEETLETQNSTEETVEQAEESNIPDKYQGKSVQDIITMHQNAEQEIGRQANEVGTYRELVATLSDAKRATDLSEADTTEEQTVEVTSDDLFDNPTGAIERVVQRVVDAAISPINDRQKTTDLQAEISDLLVAHPDAEQIGADPDFVAFVERSPYRIAEAKAWVEKQDVNAAKRLLEDFKDFKGPSVTPVDETASDTPSKIEQARKIATESGRTSSGDNKGRQTLSKLDVAKVFTTDRALYDTPAYQKALHEHARNGTLV